MNSDAYNSVAKELLEVQRTLGWMDLVIGSIDEAVYVTDDESRIVFANQYFSDMLKIPRVFLLGHEMSDVFNIKLEKRLTAELASDTVLREESTAVYSWKVSNEKYLFKISKKLIPTTKQVVYLAKDITREQELSNMKSSFINLASHQLRTPMTSVMLHSHLLSDIYATEPTSRPKEIAESITRSSERMIRLINDILNITKIQNESLYKTTFEPISLYKIVTDVKTDVQAVINEKEIDFSIKIRKNFPHINSDSNAVREIISNLVTNALQYTTPRGSITIMASVTNDTVEVVVADTGIGIPAKALGQIYDQFARADNAFEKFNEGTGLGLYLVKLLLVKIGGNIDCKSRLHKGTTFTVSLPRVANN